jgi:hypothetical protein
VREIPQLTAALFESLVPADYQLVLTGSEPAEMLELER